MKDITKLATLASLTALMPSACKAPEAAEDGEKKPLNIVYIMCDDHSYQTISAYDNRFIETPNIDRIGAEGVRFTNSFGLSY